MSIVVEFHYRIISDPSWQVQKQHRGEWVTAWYCKDEASAIATLKRSVDKTVEWSRLTPEERAKRILK